MATATNPRGKNTLTIPSGTKPSNELDLTGPSGTHLGPWNFTILAPATLTGTVTIQVSDAVGGTYRTVSDPAGTDYTIAAGKAQIIRGIYAGALQIASGSNEGADRAFVVYGSPAPTL